MLPHQCLPSAIRRAPTFTSGRQPTPVSLNEEMDVLIRVQLMRIDARQHDLIIANRDDSVALILPNVDISLVEFAFEFEFVHSWREIRNRCPDPTFSDYEC